MGGAHRSFVQHYTLPSTFPKCERILRLYLRLKHYCIQYCTYVKEVYNARGKRSKETLYLSLQR
jgi:hypothetical protein